MKNIKFLVGIFGISLLVVGCSEEVDMSKLSCNLEHDVNGLMTETIIDMEYDETGKTALNAVVTTHTNVNDPTMLDSEIAIGVATCERYADSVNITCESTVDGNIVTVVKTLDVDNASDNDLLEVGVTKDNYDIFKSNLLDLTYTCE